MSTDLVIPPLGNSDGFAASTLMERVTELEAALASAELGLEQKRDELLRLNNKYCILKQEHDDLMKHPPTLVESVREIIFKRIGNSGEGLVDELTPLLEAAEALRQGLGVYLADHGHPDDARDCDAYDKAVRDLLPCHSPTRS